MFKALRFIDEKNSFRENELITDVIICFAPVQEHNEMIIKTFTNSSLTDSLKELRVIYLIEWASDNN